MKNSVAPPPPLNEETAGKLRRKRQKNLVIWSVRFGGFLAIVSLLLCASADVQRHVMLLSPTFVLAKAASGASSLIFNAPLGILSVLLAVASATITLLCFFKKRFFCRYVCPLGFCVDVAALIRRRIFKQKQLRYGLVFRSRIGFAFFSTFWALVSLPLLLNVRFFNVKASTSALAFDPFAILSRVLLAPGQSSFIIILFVVCFLISPFFWRYQFCPCGAIQELLFLPKRIVSRIIRLATHVKRDEDLSQSETTRQETASSVHSRRRFFATGGAISLSLLFYETLRRQLQRTSAFFFRPPGAVPEGEFLTRCTRCGRCVAACPNKLLTLVRFNEEGTASEVNPETSTVPRNVSDARIGLLAQSVLRNVPQVDFSSGKQYCEKDCVACTLACPTGAIRPLLSEEKSQTPIALAAFNAEHCMLYYDQECSICRRECPYEAIDFVWNEEEYSNLPVIDEERCVGCGRCVVSCPGEPIFRELGVEEPDKEETERIKALSLVRRN